MTLFLKNSLACVRGRSDECPDAACAAGRSQQMKFYTIEKDTNHIAVHASVKEAQAVAGAERFSSETTLTKVAAAWPTSRLISIWNTLPGLAPVRRFASRELAL